MRLRDSTGLSPLLSSFEILPAFCLAAGHRLSGEPNGSDATANQSSPSQLETTRIEILELVKVAHS